jgi:hypothetical protein
MTRAYNGNIPKNIRGSLGLNISRRRPSMKKSRNIHAKKKAGFLPLARDTGLQTWPPTISKGLRLVSEKD